MTEQQTRPPRNEPATQAGRDFLRRKHRPEPTSDMGSAFRESDRLAILAIEAEARDAALREQTRITVDLPSEALEWARQLVEQGYRDEHIVTFTEDGYGLEHPIRCRPNLTGCILNEWLATQMAPDREPGRYVMEWSEHGPRYGVAALPRTPGEDR